MLYVIDSERGASERRTKEIGMKLSADEISAITNGNGITAIDGIEWRASNGLVIGRWSRTGVRGCAHHLRKAAGRRGPNTKTKRSTVWARRDGVNLVRVGVASGPAEAAEIVRRHLHNGAVERAKALHPSAR